MTQTMTPRVHAETPISRAMVRAMTALVLVILTLVTLFVLSGRPLESTPPQGATAREAVIYLSSDMSGAARVLDAHGSVLAELGPDDGGFVAGVHRVIEFERAKRNLPDTAPVRLVAQDTGRMAIIDPLTGWRADLMGFGTDNAAAFAKLLAQSDGTTLGYLPASECLKTSEGTQWDC